MEIKTITLATLAESTEQEVFDYIVSSLLKQNDKSVDEKGYCKYRSIGGRKCAAGFLISDEEYMGKFEGKTWNVLELSGLVPKEHYSLIHALQKVHDGLPVSSWKKSFKEVAEKFNLSTSNLQL